VLLGPRRNVGRLDHIDLPTARAYWQILSDDAGRAFSWINYAPIADAESGRPEAFRIAQPCEVLGDNGWVLGPEGWYACCSWYSGHTYLPPALRPFTPKYRRRYRRTVDLGGLTLSALTDHGAAYGHMVMEGLYKLLKGIEVVGGAARLDQILIPQGMERVLDRSVLGDEPLLRSKLLTSDPRTLYRTDALIAVTHPACSMNVSQAQLDLLRTARRTDRTGPARRIFLARPPGGRRGITNLDEVVRLFEGHHYLIASGARLEDSWAAFADAEIVAGVHGSDLADCIFMRRGSTLLEILPSDHRKPYYFNVAARQGIDFRCLLARSLTRRPTVHGLSSADITVDVAALDAVLDAIDEGLPSTNRAQERVPLRLEGA
jgi:Glycosyltransferase 61